MYFLIKYKMHLKPKNGTYKPIFSDQILKYEKRISKSLFSE